jgi:hypothetical protein
MTWAVQPNPRARQDRAPAIGIRSQDRALNPASRWPGIVTKSKTGGQTPGEVDCSKSSHHAFSHPAAGLALDDFRM